MCYYAIPREDPVQMEGKCECIIEDYPSIDTKEGLPLCWRYCTEAGAYRP